MSFADSKRAFFRQSSWMMIATVISGACMFLVHPLSKRLPAGEEGEYSIFVILLKFMIWMSIPATSLQMVFAHLSASAVSMEKRQELAGAVRSILKATFGIWVLAVGVVLLFRQSIIETWELTNPLALWLALGIGLVAMWTPVFVGILQGNQNFLWMGWSIVANGLGRLVLAVIAVFLFTPSATGLMLAAFLAYVPLLAISSWQSRDSWLGPSRPFPWTGWLRRMIPYTLGAGSVLFMLTADSMVLKTWYSKEDLAPYLAAGVLAQALVQFTAPLAAVMFPKIVHSLVHNTRTDALTLSLMGTLVLGLAGAGMLSLLSPLVLKLGFNARFAAGAELLPAYAFAMVPLALANVLVNNLMARSAFIAAPWLAFIAAAFMVLLTRLDQPSFKTVLLWLGLFNGLLLAAAAAFSLSLRKSSHSGTPSNPTRPSTAIEE